MNQNGAKWSKVVQNGGIQLTKINWDLAKFTEINQNGPMVQLKIVKRYIDIVKLVKLPNPN